MVKRSKGGEETPQVFFNNMHVGGYNELIELVRLSGINSSNEKFQISGTVSSAMVRSTQQR